MQKFGKIKNIPTHTLIRLLDESNYTPSHLKDYGCPYFKDEASRILWERFEKEDARIMNQAIDELNDYEYYLDSQGVPELPVDGGEVGDNEIDKAFLNQESRCKAQGVPEIPEQYYIDRFLLDTK